MSQRPGGNSRGRGDKRKNYRRGGGHRFTRVEVYNADGDAVSPWSKDAILDAEDKDSSSSSEGSSGSGSESDGAGPSSRPAYIQEEHPGPQLTQPDRGQARKERKEAARRKAAQKVVQVGDLPSSESDSEASDVPAPKAKAKAPVKKAVSDSSSSDESGSLASNMKELSVADKMKAKEELRQKVVAAQMSEAQREEMERLKKIREQREMKQRFLEAEKEDVDDKNTARVDKTKALLEKAQKNKSGGKKKKRGGKA